MIYNATRYTVSSALPYANGPLHIGHLAGAILPADIFARFLRLMEKDVLYVCGSDEHGAAITMKAIQEKTAPKEIIDRYHQLFEDTFQKLDISFDVYHRTSDPLHHETSQEFFKRLFDAGKFETRNSEQYYDPEAGQFLADRYIMGTCPKCGYEEAYGDQCEKCGSSLSPMELIDPVSKLSGAKPEIRETTHWYLPLQEYESWLKEWINEGTDDGNPHHDPSEWKNHVLGQCRSWIDGGLESRAMTRDLDWGVDVPKDIEGAEGKKLYVWMDAPIGYISATKYWAKQKNKDWKPYWQDEDTALVHFIGKDNIVFHCIIFPAILKAHGDYILPQNVPANQFMNLEGRKISTSKNWAVWAHEYVEAHPDKIDELKYYLIKNMPEQKDSEFTWKSFQDACNNELVNNLANFANRVMVLCNKYYDGVLPEVDENQQIIGAEGETEFFESEMLALHDMMQDVNSKLWEFNFRGALQAWMQISARGNQLLQNNEPWKLFKTDPEKTRVVMNLCTQYLAGIAQLMKVFMPGKAEQLLNMLQWNDAGSLVSNLNHLAEGAPLLQPGHQLGEAKHLFSRIDDEWIQKELDKLSASDQDEKDASNDFKPLAEEIGFEDFMKLDIRTGTILQAEKMPKANKLLKLEVDMGFEKRTIVSGIAKHYAPDELPGKQVVVLANLAPKKLRGVMSNGMILMAENEKGDLAFVSPERDWKPGFEVK
ncbi:MAG TPA: methionine--tRNA ligase [Saprospiraceae bacterium]|nr:methionine--tRNA ligase [Saprospiraceae bacterium]